ncbi:hypothetical protein A0J61_01777 [Choanephora cucurbitarum]|uniref:F-box domain-containing protein n=1 Tax=Choanephora cucurbitarum TaxID=101091 RepID=A0A1C7NNZ8_9FUNG|nr:hypothetical protein A0J61_01777 [Choanephora cucurbitarum]
MSKDLSFEIHLQILDQLDQASVLQYQRVCKNWKRPASQKLVQNVKFQDGKKALQFINMIVASPELGKYVKHFQGIGGAPIEESALPTLRKFIQCIPQVETLVLPGYGKTLLHIAEELNKGNLKHLNNLGFPDWYSVKPCDYVKVLSAMKYLPKAISFNLTEFQEKHEEPFTLRDPLLTKRPDLLEEVKDLHFFTFSSTTIKDLDDIVNKCPVADNLSIFVKDFEDPDNRLMEIQPNMNIKKLDICCTYYTKVCVQYICKKFPKVKHLQLQDYDFYEYEEDYKLPKAALNMLKKYALGMDTYSIMLEGQRTPWDFNGSRKSK